MGREFKVGDEPVPGYRLAKFIGLGGFGKVWRAVGPGGTEVALKVIALNRKQGLKEFKSLRLVKRIHHPNLVPILAFWLVDADGVPLDDESIDTLGSNLLDTRQPGTGTVMLQFNLARAEQLVIAMGLGEKNLLDVLAEYHAQGQVGIPLEELLDYMEGAARAIDFLNTPRHNLGGSQPVAIQHCDIKPQNIMLVGDAVQVCDFGLARSLTDVRSTSVAASIAYGAPELFWDNKPTRATDQYSLAITYYELRTGHLPFGADAAAIDVMQAHRDGSLDLRYLNDAERGVIKRATDPSPSGRFERTIDMVRALQRAAHASSRPFEEPPSAGRRSSFVDAGREFVPGYTLLEHLFHPDARTDVWSSRAPGGNPQAMWLYEITPGAVDSEALKLVQQISDQPRLARLVRWWLLDSTGQDVTAGDAAGQASKLVIASDLTPRNLAHRVEECRQLRGSGIPLDGLMTYMQQVAEGIDALNDATHSLGSRRVSLIHTDLRPANLLVFGNAVKIGNFAWCRILEGEEAELAGLPLRTARPTMPPELAAGRIHRRSDQYSLAASYVQMRTGNLLLESGLPTGAASGALAGVSLDLSDLSEGEREIVQRAMHAEPGERYPSCRKLVAELALAAKKVPARAVETPLAVSSAASAPSRGRTMVPEDLYSTCPTPPVTPVISPADTNPDVRSTIEVEEAARRPTRRWGRRALALAGVLVLAVAAAGLLTGTQTEGEVERLIQNGQYKAALEAIASPLWQRWRSDPDTLRDRVVSSARDKAANAVQEGKQGTAREIQEQLNDQLDHDEQADFHEHVFGKTTQGGVAAATSGDENHAAALTPEQLVASLLDQAEQNIREGAPDDAAKKLADAEEKIDTELPRRADLHHRAVLDHAWLAWEKKEWPEAETWLGQVDASDLAGSAREDEQTRYHLLRALAASRYQGGALAEDADLDALSRSVDELRHADPNWEKSVDRSLADRAKELSRELGLHVAGLLGSAEPNQQALGKLLRDRIDRTYWPENVETVIAVNNTINLLKSKDTASGDIQQNLDRPDFVRHSIPDLMLPRLAEAFALWGRESKEPDAAQKAIVWMRSLKQTDEVRRASTSLAVAELKRAASLPDIDWKQLAGRCREEEVVAAGATEQGPFVKACLAECLTELALAASSPVPDEAQNEIDKALKSNISPADRPYVDYVAFRIGRTTGDKDRSALADSLCAGIKSSAMLTNPWRRARAAELLLAAARGLAPVDSKRDPLGVPSFAGDKQKAEQAYRWLTQANELVDASGKKLSEDDYFLLAVAAAEKQKPEQALAAAAVGGYAKALQAALKLRTASNEAIYDRIISPAMRVVDLLDEKQRAGVASPAALLYANQGRLIRLDAAVESKVFQQTRRSGADAAFAAYDKAIEFNKNTPDFYIQRGMARYNATTAQNNLAALNRDDLSNARKLLGGKGTPGLYALMGAANLLEARSVEPIDRRRREDLSKNAVAAAAKALEMADPKSEDYPQFLLLHSSACLELANSSTDSEQVVRAYLDSAVGSARKAIGGAHPEYGYQALGNAEEAYGVLLGDYDGYARAVKHFDDARLKALSPPDEALLCLGRVRYRLATCGAEPAVASQVLLASALADLREAVGSERASKPRVAEAYWWQWQIHSARLQSPSAKPSERAAADKCLRECLGRVDPASSAWAEYQLSWAGLAETPQETQLRARKVLEPTSKADAWQRAQAISMIASSYHDGKAKPEEIRQQLGQGVKEYQQYLPDFAKAKASDLPALLGLSEFILSSELVLSDRSFWSANRNLCQASAERALALAQELPAPDLVARARGDLGTHSLYMAMAPKTLDVALLRKAADHFRAAVRLDDTLATASVTALGRQTIRREFAPTWRFALAHVDVSLAQHSPGADRPALRKEALKTIDDAKELSESYKQMFDEYRKVVAAIK